MWHAGGTFAGVDFDLRSGARYLRLASVFASLGVAPVAAQSPATQHAACGTWRQLEAPTAPVHEVALPREAFAEALGAAPPGPPAGLRTAQRDDVRVYAVAGRGDTSEVAYAWREVPPAAGERRVEPLDTTRLQYGVWRYTFAADSLAALAALRLIVDRPEFDARVTVEAAATPDSLDWDPLVRGSRIAALDGPGERLRYTRVSFPPTRAPYYRVTVTGIEAPVVVAAAYAALGDAPRVLRYPDAEVDAIGIDRVDETTTVYVSLDAPALVSEVEVFASDSGEYVRPVRLEAIRDTIRRGDGTTVIRASRTAAGTISSYAPTIVDFTRPAVARHLSITVDDGGKRPLQIDSVAVRGPESSLYARFDAGPGARYFLAYGCEDLRAPRYDRAALADSRPDSPARLSVGEVVVSAPSNDPRAVVGAGPLWGWWVYLAAALAVAFAVATWVLLRLRS